MKPFTKEELRELMEMGEEPSVSFFLPTNPVSTESQQNRIKLKNLLRQAEDQLKESGYRPSDIEKLLQPVDTLLNESLFWSHQQEGLAAFVNRRLFRYYRLPHAFEELAEAGRQFHLKPLLPLLTQDFQFYLLTLSQNQIGLFQCSSTHIYPLDLDGIPESLDEAMRYDQPEKQLQFSTRTPQSGGGEMRAAAFHGQGIGMENTKKDLLQFFHKVDAGIQQKMATPGAPLMLAGVDYLFPIYREANTYPHLMENGIAGNPEELTPQQLHQQALELVAPLLKEAQLKGLAQYAELDGTGRTARETGDIVAAAQHGRIETLFVAKGAQQWGSFSPETQEVVLVDAPSPDHEDLLNMAALQAYLNGGTVFLLSPDEMPSDSHLSAIYRY
ncbi:hypothetical protein [Anoxynatronum sibiricum]|uniref:Uncharacterized protein n=1 Tax=Anoxynatronum sibiricum TaxID=210623 RepID=A0ABU9VYT4_9CLOT